MKKTQLNEARRPPLTEAEAKAREERWLARGWKVTTPEPGAATITLLARRPNVDPRGDQ